MHVLIITHVDFYSIYGAATSLRHHVQLIRERSTSSPVKITIVNRVGFKKALGYTVKGNGTGRINRDPNFRIIDLWSLPFENNYDGHPEETGSGGPMASIKKSLQSVLYKRSLKKITKLIRQENVSVVHLNASVLASVGRDIRTSLVTACPMIVMHIRDFIKKNITQKQVRDFDIIDRFICIDKASYDRLLEVTGKKIGERAIVLQNLFIKNPIEQLTPVAQLQKSRASRKYVIVGRISALKGVVFVIDAFLEAAIDDSMLFVVGNGDGAYYHEVLAKCEAHPQKLTYIPEFANLSESDLYYKADFLVRGDESFRTGRTVYEALAYDTRIILPGDIAELNNDVDLFPFRNSVFLYNASDLDALVQTFRDTALLPVVKTSASKNFFKEKADLYYQQISAMYNAGTP